jgi:DNA-binding NtrC family response regulator
VLDTSTFRHIGGTNEIRVDVRVVAASNRDLGAMVRQGLFREDLYYRLSTITLKVPALRTRPGDVELLAAHFAGMLNDRFGFRKRIGPEALELLRRHYWPGNVRELLHVVEAAMVVCNGAGVLPEHLPPPPRAERYRRRPVLAPSTGDPRLPTLAELERTHIERARCRRAGASRERGEDLGDQRAQPLPEAARVQPPALSRSSRRRLHPKTRTGGCLTHVRGDSSPMLATRKSPITGFTGA